MNESAVYRLHRLVFTLDRAGDKILRLKFGISNKRGMFLAVLQGEGPMTQHELAVALGYSDPAVSTMLVELAKDGYVTTTPSPVHKRKHIVALTSKGEKRVTKARQVLETSFDKLLATAGVDVKQYSELTERIYQALIAKGK